MLETEYPDIHKEFKKGHFAVQDYGGYFTATQTDMRLEQII